MLVDLDDEIRRMNNDEYISKHKVSHLSIFRAPCLFPLQVGVKAFLQSSLQLRHSYSKHHDYDCFLPLRWSASAAR